MARKMLPIKEWQDRLTKHFTVDGVVGGSLLSVFRIEELAGDLIAEKYFGFQRLCDASQGFAFDTIKLLSQREINETAQKHPSFPFVFIDYAMIFRRLRAAHIVAHSGYLGAGFASLREVKDRALLLAALHQGRVSYDDLMGISKDDPKKATKEELQNRHRKRRMTVERDIVEEFLGQKSGLNEDDIFELKRWNDLFDREMHGSFLSSTVAATGWLRGERKFALVNLDDEQLELMFINRYCETSWMYHRILPFLFTQEAKLDRRWSEHWNILDESFWQMESSLDGVGKKIGGAFIRFMDAKLPFNADSRMK